MPSKSLLASLSLLLVLFATQAISAQDITLKFSHYLPESHGFHADFIQSWAEELKTRTDGQVTVEIYPGTSSFGNAARQSDQVRAGVIDIALGLRGIPRGRFPASSVIEMPFLVEHAGPGSKALWTLYKEGLLGDEYGDFKVLALFVHNGGLFHTIDKPVRQLDDLKGLRLRTPSAAVSAMLEYLGASPVGLPPAQIYENLEKGVLDGVVTTWDLVGAIRLNEVLQNHTDARAYTAAFYVVMNRRKYDSLPEDVRNAIDDISGDALVEKFGPWWQQWDSKGREDAVQRGHTIIEVDEQTRTAWREQLGPMIEQHLKTLEDEGVANAPAIYQRAQELIDQFDAERAQ